MKSDSPKDTKARIIMVVCLYTGYVLGVIESRKYGTEQKAVRS